MIKKILLVLCLFAFGACAIGPLNGPQTARTLGEGNWEVNSGLAYIAPYLTVTRGISDNLDLGLSLESQSFGLLSVSLKYSIFNNTSDGFSGALALSGFQTINPDNTKGFYAAPIVSYRRSGWFESFLVVRYNWLRWKAYRLNSDDKDDFIVDFINSNRDMDISYLQSTFGLNFWTSDTFAIGLDAKVISFFGNHIEDSDKTAVVPGLNFIWKL